MSAEDEASIGGLFCTSAYIEGLGMTESYTGFCSTNASFFVTARKSTRCDGAASDLRSLCTGGGTGFATHARMICKV
jgi:hypothetical protein